MTAAMPALLGRYPPLSSVHLPAAERLKIAVERASHSRQLVIKVVPTRVGREDELHLPGSQPVFQILLALDRCPDVVVALCPDEALQAILLCKPLGYVLTMFP